MNLKTKSASDDMLKNKHIFNLHVKDIVIFKSLDLSKNQEQSINIPLYNVYGECFVWSLYGTEKSDKVIKLFKGYLYIITIHTKINYLYILDWI